MEDYDVDVVTEPERPAHSDEAEKAMENLRSLLHRVKPSRGLMEQQKRRRAVRALLRDAFHQEKAA